MLERLNGMFALAIADLRSRDLHVVRDHFGIKPLHYIAAETGIYVASEKKALLPFSHAAASGDAGLDQQTNRVGVVLRCRPHQR